MVSGVLGTSGLQCRIENWPQEVGWGTMKKDVSLVSYSRPRGSLLGFQEKTA